LPIALGLTDVGKRDFYRIKIPQGPTFDIGAHEHQQQRIPSAQETDFGAGTFAPEE
jgi:hypothetical protein